MKKYIYSAIMFLMLMSISISTYSRPIYIHIRIGIRAVWQVTQSECLDGNGICLSIGDPDNPNNALLGYDESFSNLFSLKVSRSNDLAKYFSTGKFELKEDSPINPNFIAKFSAFKNSNKKQVILKKGVYPVKIEGEYYVVEINYYLQ